MGPPKAGSPVFYVTAGGNEPADSSRVVAFHATSAVPFVGREGPRKSKPAKLPHRASASAAICENLARAADDIAWNGACVLAGSDPEAVHQIRVALRRLRAVLSLYRELLPEKMHDHLRDLARVVNGPLGAARNADVFCDDVLAAASRAMPEDPDLAALAAAAERERETRWAKAREMLRSEFFAGLIAAADSMAREPSSRGREEDAVLSSSAWRFAAKSLKRRHKRLRDRGRHLRHMSAAERHKLRIAAKKQRYAAELFAPLFKKSRGRKYAGALARVQSALGEMNDIAGMPAQLQALLAKAGGDAALARAAGLVLGYYQAGAAAREERLRDAWKRFKAAKKFWRSSASAL